MHPLRLTALLAALKTIALLVIAFRCSLSSSWAADLDTTTLARAAFTNSVKPLVASYCVKCHSTEKHKGDIDLEQFAEAADVLKHPKIWERAFEQLSNGDMPPADKPQPTAEERRQMVAGVNSILDAIAQSHAGDPGPVVLRRLNNAEYTYTIRDLTGVESLDPAKEFPGDSASGEGFMNVGNSLVMSPALLDKYLNAAKEITKHAVLLPDGIGFAAGISARDWTDEKLAAIRAFYSRFTENGGGTSVNLQGIKFDTKDGGVLPMEKYLEATLAERAVIKSGQKTIAAVAGERGLNAKYLGLLWNALNDSTPSLLLDQVRTQWRVAKPGQVQPLLSLIRQWQQTLWLFTSVGHIGKRDGPKAWQEAVTPLVSSREVHLKIPATTANEFNLYLVTSDAGDGNKDDFAVWENPRLVAPGRPDLPLRDVRTTMAGLSAFREKVIAGAAECLFAAAEAHGLENNERVAELAQKRGVESEVLAAWLNYLGLGGTNAKTPVESLMRQKLEKTESYDFVKGWVGADALSVLANSSDQTVRIPGTMKAHSVAVHPSPKLRVVVGWRSPLATVLHAEATVQHAHTECGNGVDWLLELRRGQSRLRLAAGIAQDGTEFKVGPFEDVPVQPDDFICLSVGPRDGNHACDLTSISLRFSDSTRRWDLATDISANILDGNPHADNLGNAGVWHFYSEPDTPANFLPVVPAGSLLAKWRLSTDPQEKNRLARQIQSLLSSGPKALPKDSADTALYNQITSLNGPLLASLFQAHSFGAGQNTHSTGSEQWGLDPSMFGIRPGFGKMDDNSLGVHAPSVITVRLPVDLAEGCEFVATATLQADTGAEGSVQMQVLASEPAGLGLLAGSVRERGAKATWSDGQLPVVSESPIIVRDSSAAKARIETAFNEFRQLFPAALCYTKIVPVDEVVTLTLFYREDEHLRRLMLNEAEAAELDRLWAELHYVSQDALKSVDAFDQLWQFATQDADPRAFEPLREPLKQKAAEFRKLLEDTQPLHLDAVLKFAERGYRRPLTAVEKEQLRALYQKLRDQELPHEQAIRLALARVLTAPAFLYRTEAAPVGNKPAPITDWELATRLSYFLWSSGPDEPLTAAAAARRLEDPAVLTVQARRMLKDPRVRRLSSEFAAAWLQIHGFESLDEKSERHFPTFRALRAPMYEEAIRFFTDLFQNDRSVLSLLDADYAFLNGPLAEHYGIPGITGPEWRRVDHVRQYDRGGVLGLGAVLAKQSGASRTSPILRGNWVAEVLLGDRLPRPPKDVPRLPEDEATEALTVRQLVEKHDADPRCAGCHAHIDGYGFTLEGFDAIGRQRGQDLAGRPVDTRAKVFDGTLVDGADGLRGYLLHEKRAAVLNQFARKLLGYALGRAVILSDRPLLAEIQRQLERHDFRFSAAVETIVTSPQFREIRGQDMVVSD